MRRWTILVGFLALAACAKEDVPPKPPGIAPVLAQDVKEEEIVKGPEPEIPEEIVVGEPLDGLPPGGRITRGERDAPAVFARLRDGGVLEVKAGDDWKAVTLEDCSSFLARAREEHGIERRRIGESELEDLGGGREATRLFLSIDVEPAVPSRHVQWLMSIAEEQKYHKLELSDGKRNLLVLLPVDVAIEYAKGYGPPPEIEVHLVVRKEEPAKWGDLDVLRPTEVRCRVGDAETTDLKVVADLLKKARSTAERKQAVLCGEIKAGQKVPFEKVFDVMETLVAAGIIDVDLYGTAIPSKAVRSAARLPYPAKNYDTD